jgi:hypothetical protein
MVPCPEGHVDELLSELMRLTFGMSGWTVERATSFLAEIEGDDRRLVLAVARSAAEHQSLSYRAAAQHLETDVGSVFERVMSVNARCDSQGWPMPLISEGEDSGDDDGVKSRPVLRMTRPFALTLLGRSDQGDPAEDGPDRWVDVTDV